MSAAAKAPSHRDATDAAGELGVSQWGSPSGAATELVLQLDRAQGVLTASLPTTAPEAAAKRWLQDAADHLGWASPSLSMHRGAGALWLKLEGGRAARDAGATTSRIDLTLAPLAARLGRLSSQPVLLCVRLPGAAVTHHSPAPINEGSEDGDHFLFYQPSAMTAGPLSIEFGIPPRWPVAAVVAALLWLAAPFGMALGVRAYLSQHQWLPAMQRVTMFERWMLAARIAAVAGLCATLLALDLDRLRYLGLHTQAMIGGTFPLAPFWFWCQGASGMVRQRLVREADPDAPMSGYEAMVCLVTAVLFILFILSPGLMSGLPGTVPAFGPSTIIATGPATSGWFLMLGGTLLLLLFLPAYFLCSRMGQRAVTRAPVDDPAALKAALHELTEQAVLERQEYTANPELLDKFAAVAQMNTLVALAPDQQAAIGVAGQHAAFESSLRTRWQAGAACGIAVLIILSGIWQRLQPLGNGALRALLFCGLCFTVGSIVFRCYLGRSRQRQGEVDLQVALTMDEPRRYLEALRKLAEYEQFNSVMMNSASVALGFKERARQLARRLHLE